MTTIRKQNSENPVQKLTVISLKSSTDTNGKYNLVDVEMAPGGHVAAHYHTVFTKTFYAIDGVLDVKIKGRTKHLHSGEFAFVDKREVHSFSNPSNTPIRFRVKMEPASVGFIQSLIIANGLAADGLTNGKGLPKNLDHLAVLLRHSNSRLAGWPSLFDRMLMRRALKAEQNGVKEMLIRRYWQPQ